MLNHGGNLQAAQAASSYQGEWLDLSTGISPWSWPVTMPPEAVWQRLPEITPAFEQAVAAYYGSEQLIAVPGSQYAIEALPRLLPKARVAMPFWGYGEHAKAWQKAGHELVFYHSFTELLALCGQVEHAVVINPNNPTGEYWSEAQLLQIEQCVPGYVVVDKAFADSVEVPSQPVLQQPRRITLRSLGKFFGLAGLRLGFVELPEALREAFLDKQLLWGVSSISLWVAEQALADRAWQQQQRQRIAQQRGWVKQYLLQYFSAQQLSEGPLFVSVYGQYDDLLHCQQRFAECGVWLRLFHWPQALPYSYLRIGLPADMAQLHTMTQTLEL